MRHSLCRSPRAAAGHRSCCPGRHLPESVTSHSLCDVACAENQPERSWQVLHTFDKTPRTFYPESSIAPLFPKATPVTFKPGSIVVKDYSSSKLDFCYYCIICICGRVKLCLTVLILIKRIYTQVLKEDLTSFPWPTRFLWAFQQIMVFYCSFNNYNHWLKVFYITNMASKK